MRGIVYVLGTTRSGTSALRNAIVQTRYSGYGEGHLVPVLVDLVRTVRSHKQSGLGANVEGNALFLLDEDALIAELFRGYENYLVERVKSDHVLDKTPTVVPIQFAEDLAAYHRNASFIYCSRRHVDNVQSKIKKFGRGSFTQHCQEWAACARAWTKAREGLDARYVEFDFKDLAGEPDHIAARIGELLGLDDGEIGRMARYLRGNRPEGNAERDLLDHLKFSGVDWTDEERKAFLRICGPLGEELGYGLETYDATEGAGATDPS